MTARYEWMGDKGEIVGLVSFEEGSKGQVVELDEKVADEHVSNGFPLKKLKPVKPGKEAA